MKAKSRKSNSNSDGDWILTYSDVVTLLLTFFVLLFSFSEINAFKWRELVMTFTGKEIVAIDEGSGVIVGDPTEINIIDQSQSPVRNEEEEEEEEEEDEEIDEEKVEETQEGIEDFISGISEEFKKLYDVLMDYSRTEGDIHVTMNEYQIRIRLSNNLLFDPAKAAVTERNESILKELSKIIYEFEDTISRIVVEGNTDDIPINNDQYKDNFELSLARSLAVLYYLKYNMDFHPGKLVPMGYGEYNPIGDNSTEEGRAMNRRTDIVLVKDISINAEGEIDYSFLGPTDNREQGDE